jgi:hypothetical protein
MGALRRRAGVAAASRRQIKVALLSLANDGAKLKFWGGQLSNGRLTG